MKKTWTYKARDYNGNLVKGRIEGDSYEQVMQSISNEGLIPTKVKQTMEGASFSNIMGNFSSANREGLIIFTKKLLTLYNAGIPLVRSLSIIGKGAQELGLQEELSQIKEDIQSGLPLSKAFEKHPKKFPQIYIASIAAGESSGTLDEVLSQLAHLIEKELVLTRQIKSAIRYPVMVIIAISLAVFVLMTFVVPKFSGIYGKLGAELPLPTKIVMGTSQIFSSYWYLILILAGIGIYALKKFISSTKGRLIWDEMLLRIPILGDLIIKFNIARFATMLKSLFRSAVPMVTCLNILETTTSNVIISKEIAQIADSFEKGREIGLDDGHTYKYFPNMALELFQVGLESGSIESMMGELANHYEMELEYKSQQMTAMLEPILTVFIGAMVLVLALSIFLPMWDLIKVFQ